jgi:two-component system, LytTR family, response regulator
MKQLFIPTNKGLKVVMAQNIIRVEASSSYCKIYFDNEHPLTVAKLLQWFEKKLPYEYFYRIHRTHIVNRLFISNISGDSRLTLSNGEQLQVSRRKKNIVHRIATAAA